MSVTMNTALQAYRTAARTASPTPSEASAGGANGEGSPNFGDLVRGSLQKAVEINRVGEAMSLQGIAGEADMRDVVLAVNNAEIALNTVIAVRDKVVGAYQSILQMPI